MSVPLPPFAFGTADDFNDVRDCVPRTLMSLAAKGTALLGLEPRVVAAVGLAHLAASLGRSFFFDDGRTRIPGCFNLAVVSERLPASDWTVSLGRGWTESATQLQTMHSLKLRELIRNCVRDAATKRTERNIDPQFEAYEKEIPLNVVNMLRRCTITSKVDPDAVARAIVDSRDHCVLMVNGAGDPMEEWSQLSPAKRKRLAELLVLSWQCKPVTIPPTGAELLGTAHLLWQTSREQVRRAMFDRRMPSFCRSTPVLLFQHSGEPKRMPDVHAAEFMEWSHFLKSLSDYRSQPNCNSDFTLAKPEQKAVDEFFAQFAIALAKAPASMQPYLAWLPDLLMRLIPAILTAKTMDALKQQNIEGTTKSGLSSTVPQNAPVTMMQEAVRLTRWLCQEHYRTVCSYLAVTSADSDQQATDNTDTERLEEDILQRLKDNGPQTHRELQRRFHELPAKTRDEVLRRLKTKGAVIENSEGKLELAA
ncbi:MAG: hypothetical protein WAW39_30145 [Prosthecobacter sp.]|uniref:hypothetical protein n=1 Tax=Prosthecobacter sp. TaxID=1965333 RepID=UPI003BB0AF1F